MITVFRTSHVYDKPLKSIFQIIKLAFQQASHWPTILFMSRTLVNIKRQALLITTQPLTFYIVRIICHMWFLFGCCFPRTTHFKCICFHTVCLTAFAACGFTDVWVVCRIKTTHDAQKLCVLELTLCNLLQL